MTHPLYKGDPRAVPSCLQGFLPCSEIDALEVPFTVPSGWEHDLYAEGAMRNVLPLIMTVEPEVLKPNPPVPSRGRPAPTNNLAPDRMVQVDSVVVANNIERWTKTHIHTQYKSRCSANKSTADKCACTERRCEKGIEPVPGRQLLPVYLAQRESGSTVAMASTRIDPHLAEISRILLIECLGAVRTVVATCPAVNGSKALTIHKLRRLPANI